MGDMNWRSAKPPVGFVLKMPAPIIDPNCHHSFLLAKRVVPSEPPEPFLGLTLVGAYDIKGLVEWS